VGYIDRTIGTGGTFNFGKGGNSNAARIKPEYLFTAEEVKRGIRLNIDMTKVQDVDTSDDAKIYEKLMQ
jgi:hypothetical protein